MLYHINTVCDFQVTEIQSRTIFASDAMRSSVIPEFQSPNVHTKTGDRPHPSSAEGEQSCPPSGPSWPVVG